MLVQRVTNLLDRAAAKKGCRVRVLTGDASCFEQDSFTGLLRRAEGNLLMPSRAGEDDEP